MKRTILALALLASAIVAGAAPSVARAGDLVFTCTAPVAGEFVCSIGSVDFECLAGNPVPGTFTCDGPGKRAMVCTRSGVNAATCTVYPSGKLFDCDFVGDLSGGGTLTCVKKP